MDLREAKQFLNKSGYRLVEKMTDEERNAKRRAKYAEQKAAEQAQNRADQRQRDLDWSMESTKKQLEIAIENGLADKVERVQEWYDKLTQSGLGKVTYMSKLNKLMNFYHDNREDEIFPEEWFEEHGLSGDSPKTFTYTVPCTILGKYKTYDVNVGLNTDTISSWKLAHQSDVNQRIVSTYARLGAPICKKLWADEKLELGPDEVIDFLSELVDYELDAEQTAKLADIKDKQAKLDDEIYNFEKGLRYHGT
jgi:hypothetical protein